MTSSFSSLAVDSLFKPINLSVVVPVDTWQYVTLGFLVFCEFGFLGFFNLCNMLWNISIPKYFSELLEVVN